MQLFAKDSLYLYIMKAPNRIPEINRAVFWDVPIEDVDYTKDSSFIISRVFNYGNFQEIADIIVYYGKDYVKEFLLSFPDLTPFGLENASAFFRIPEKQFQCYIRIQHRLNS